MTLSEWDTTPEAYRTANTDANLQGWWDQQDQSENFARQLGSQFGDRATFFSCGVGLTSTCSISGARAFEDAEDGPWPYMALVSLVNMNQHFNAIHDGITQGQMTFISRINSLARDFFPDKNDFPSQSVTWITAILSVLLALPTFSPFKIPAHAAYGATTGSFLNLVGAGAGAVEADLESSIREDAETEMFMLAGHFGQRSRDAISRWANDTFEGFQDQNGNDIL